jgi:hypothetical protein
MNFSEFVNTVTAVSTVIAAFGTIIAATIAAIAAWAATKQVKILRIQIEQTNAQMLTTISNQQNWEFLKHYSDLPPALPSWQNQSREALAWRVIHMNHLNFLQLVQQSSARGLLPYNEVAASLLKGRFWFRQVWQDASDPMLHEGREVLRQILRPEEGYP